MSESVYPHISNQGIYYSSIWAVKNAPLIFPYIAQKLSNGPSLKQAPGVYKKPSSLFAPCGSIVVCCQVLCHTDSPGSLTAQNPNPCCLYCFFFFFDPLVWNILISPHLCQYKYLLPFVPKVWGFISSNFSYDFDSALRIYYLYTKAPWYRVGRQHGLWDTEWERESEI